jgi:hypothetical protein
MKIEDEEEEARMNRYGKTIRQKTAGHIYEESHMSGPDTTQNIQITCRSLARPQS